LLSLLIASDNIHSQEKSPLIEPVDTSIWPFIESRFKQPGGDTARYFILNQVRSHCGEKYDCLCRTYHGVMFKLERRFNLLAAIYVAGEMAKVAERQGDLESEAKAYKNLSRFHGAIGNDRLTIVHLEKALRLYEQAGNPFAIINTKAAILEQRLSYQSVGEILPELEALLAQAIEKNDTGNMNYLHLRLILYTQKAGLYDEMEKHVSFLEKIPLSDPIKPMEYGEAIHAALGRADLFMVKKNYPEAERFYQKTLRLCEAEPSRWMEIQVLHKLAKLEWERKNAASAKSYLDSAFVKAERLLLHDHLAGNFELKAMMAEAEKRYGDALEFIRKKEFHQQEFDSRGAGFDMQNYYLQLEKDQLAAEKEKQALELRLKNNQLRNSLIITFLVLLLAAGLFIGLYKQRQGKQQLASQNTVIRHQSEQLKNLDAAKSRFFANISHELRTPLTLLLAPIRTMLQEDQLTKKQHRLLQIAHQGGKELKQLVNEILDLRKLESGKMELHEEPTEISTFFNRYAAQFESLAQRKQVDFSIENAVAPGVVANIDREKCRQVLYNLLSNAFKFTPPGGRVKMEIGMRDEGRGTRDKYVTTASSVLPHPSSLRLAVSDTGSGIHPDDLPHVFDRYFQTLQPGKPAEGGTGIGLAICHEYAKLFGGKIEVESALGTGSVFRMSFPVRLAENLQPTTDNSDAEDLLEAPFANTGDKNTLPAASGAPKPTLLVVEDNPELQAYIRLILQEKYQVVTAENGQAALSFLRDEGRGMRDERGIIPHPSSLLPDMVLSDLMMPVMDGYQLLEKLKSEDATRHIPVIMLTARADKDDRLRALRIGVDDYLTKPFDEEELLVRIENLLKNKAVRQAEADTETVDEKATLALPEGDRVWLENFEKHIRENLSSSLLTVPALAQEFAMSESTLLRQLKRLTGLSPVQYLQEMRLDKARQLLEERSGNTLAKVAAEVGYADVRSFSRSFRQRFGKLPSELARD
jgi:signal transduction histidine kinase/DNA-binding response OmpR family regulator